jgi:deoxycytidylate deaminase
LGWLGSKHAEVELDDTTEAKRLESYMQAGRTLKESTARGDLLALHAISEISRGRLSNGDTEQQSMPVPRRAYVIRSLKHPDEVDTLRQVYREGFFLVGIYSTEEERLRYLTKEKNCNIKEAKALIEKDRDESEIGHGGEFGQRTRDTFALADVFIRFDPNESKRAEGEVHRFLDLVFGNPHHTPTQDEHAMFMAHAAALRSGDLSRQVGAVVASPQGDILSVGANDVPRANGGLYWPGTEDQRDRKRGYDANEKRRDEIALDIYKRMFPDDRRLDDALLAEAKKRLDGGLIWDITEYGRAVHAEMEALLSCARNGGQVRGAVLYSTTFPCHNCAKHIVCSGVTRVVYIEPYPKSQAMALHDDSIAVEQADKPKVVFEPFIGLGPRRFMDLFSMSLGAGYRVKRKRAGKLMPWTHSEAEIRVPMLPSSYLEREQLVVSEIAEIKKVKSKSGTEKVKSKSKKVKSKSRTKKVK